MIHSIHSAMAPSSLSHGEIQATSKETFSVNKNLAYHYTSLGSSSGITIGKSLNMTLKWLTLSAPASQLGNAIQGGYDSQAPTTFGKARYWTGAAIKGLANITGSVCSLTSATVSTGVSLITNLGDVAQRLVKASVLGLAAGAEYLLSSSNRANQRLEQARAIITPSFIQRAQQEPLTLEGARAVNDAAKLARISGSSKYREMPENHRHATIADIPKSVLAIRSDNTGGNGSKLKLHISHASAPQSPFYLKSDSWSALKVAVYKRDNTTILSFVGTQPTKRPATLKSDLAGMLGIKDSAFKDAELLVSEFKKTHKNVEVIGHSLGGALAQYSGIKHGVKVTAFNSMGLHVHLRDRLADKLNSSDVTHVNTSSDPLSQFAENGYIGPDASSQVGKRYVIENSGGHRMGNITEGLKAIIDA